MKARIPLLRAFMKKKNTALRQHHDCRKYNLACVQVFAVMIEEDQLTRLGTERARTSKGL
jgi:hypothetical protein